MADEPVVAATETPAVDPAAAAVPAPAPNLLNDNPAAAAPEPTEAPVTPPAPEEPKAPVVPETYEFTAPEGVTVDAAQLEPFNAKAKEFGLTQEQYQGVVNYAIEREAQMSAAPGKAWESVQSQWRDAVLADTSISDGKALTPEASTAVSQMMQRFGTPELKQALYDTGAGNNPAVVKAFVEIGKAMQAGGMLDTGKPLQNTPKGNGLDAIAARMYPSNQGA